MFTVIFSYMAKKTTQTSKKRPASSKKQVKRIPLRKVSRRSASARANRSANRSANAPVTITPSKKLTRKEPSQLSRAAGSGKLQIKVEALINLGRERGYVTYDEILREFPTIEENVELLEDMYERFAAAGIDVL